MKFLFPLLGALLVGCASTSSTLSSSEQLNPQSSYDLIGLGLEEIRQGRPEQAMSQYFDQVIEQCERGYEQSDVRVYTARTQVENLYYLLLAAADEQEAMAVDGSCSDAIFFKGYAKLELGLIEEAESFVRQALKMAPVNAKYQSELGHIYQLKQQWQQALDIFINAEEFATTYSPEQLKVRELARAKRGQGSSFIKLGHWDQAEVLFKECLQLDPQDSVARAELQYIEQLKHSF